MIETASEVTNYSAGTSQISQPIITSEIEKMFEQTAHILTLVNDIEIKVNMFHITPSLNKDEEKTLQPEIISVTDKLSHLNGRLRTGRNKLENILKDLENLV